MNVLRAACGCVSTALGQTVSVTEQGASRAGGKSSQITRVGILARAVASLVVGLPLVSFCVVWIVSVDADTAWSRFIPVVALLV